MITLQNKVKVTMRENENLMPAFPVPKGETEDSWLKKEAERGLKERLGARCTPAHEERLQYELGVMEKMGFPGYFLVVADLVSHAKKVGIRVGPGRGSAAGS